MSFLNLFRTNAFEQEKKFMAKHFPLYSAEIQSNAEKGLVSVVLPVYNGEKYLDEAICSVLSQTYPNFELIIVDDGSTDKTGEIANSYRQSDSRIKIITQKNLKLPRALNNGFAAAKGEFYTWTSADNRMRPNCLEILAAELDRDRTCDMVFGNMRLIDENGERMRDRGWYEFPPHSGNVILPSSTAYLNTVANNTIGAAFMYRRGAAQTLVGYSEYKFMLEDYDYFMRMNSFFSIKHILYKKPIYEYRMHGESLTAHDSELGITASRPKLMELDRLRREFYQKELNIFVEGSNEPIEKALFKIGNIMHSPQAAEKFLDSDNPNLIYINLGGVLPSSDLPGIVPKYLVMQDASDGSVGYDEVICTNSISFANDREWICIKNNTAIASYIALNAKYRLMYTVEEKLSQE